MTQEEQKQKVVRVYADGVYDMFHFGHAKQLEQAKKLFPNTYLLVGVCGQDDVELFKGETVMSAVQRIEGPKHCKWVDEVIYPAPWIMDEKFLVDNNIDYVAHDDIPYTTAGIEDAYAVCKRLGKFKATKRTDGVSTSELINKILVDRNAYVKRNINRGYTRQELGLSLIEFWMFKLDFCVKKVLCPSKKKKE